MIAADTSSLIAYFTGDSGADVERITSALRAGELVLPPVVVTEILSDPGTEPALTAEIPALEMLAVLEGYWLRAAHSRRTLQKKRLRARVGDTLIAQSCIDHDVALITRDRDFRHFSAHCGLRLA